MAIAYKKYSTARKKNEGQPIVRIDDLYLVGVTDLDEVSVIADSGTITAHVTMRHLDRLGNANYAIPQHPHKGTREFAYDQPVPNKTVALAMTRAEAMTLWGLLDMHITPEGEQKIRWIRDRLAVQVSQSIDADVKEQV